MIPDNTTYDGTYNMVDNLNELAEVLEVDKKFLKKLLTSSLVTHGELYELMDNSLCAEDFYCTFINTHIAQTETQELITQIVSVLKNTDFSLCDIMSYVYHCSTELQLTVMLRIIEYGNMLPPIAPVATCELIYYDLVNIYDYIGSLNFARTQAYA